MSVLSRLKFLHNYYLRTRGIGHTKLMLEGTKNFKDRFFVMSLSLDYSNRLVRQSATHASKVAYNHSMVHLLAGRRAPLAIDNSAVMQILSEAISEIQKLEMEVRGLQAMNYDIYSNSIRLMNNFLEVEIGYETT